MEMRKYPAVFHPEPDGGWLVCFKDIPGCLTCGEDLQDAYEMAQSALALWLYDTDAPDPSSLEDVRAEEGDVVMLVEEGPGEDIIVCTPYPACGQALREGLKAKRFTMHRTAQLLGVEYRQIACLAQGKGYPCPKFAQRIGALLGLDWTRLVP
ncbi:MAG: type II toxin-antitoxin system HicB family antitoxin [Clostridia bacterium]|nr:type II toxin-antitoxin system HicB family antitoxin [Clostridia bacterium]